MKDEPAFPHHFTQDSVGDCSGMTLRDYFAAKVIAALITKNGAFDGEIMDRYAEYAYAMAEVMIETRNVCP